MPVRDGFDGEERGDGVVAVDEPTWDVAVNDFREYGSYFRSG